ncbi:GPI transamidase component Gab1p [[Candida] jaroonii]|uniref:GPI transamidase component Gab1p n=1 Tax=[Candida] jaroonii TaxID=467808 RepID=A0ACA9Y765_9ASCO|nr:GPI transamidase component Gab1p [[Candida] jaroonii]
MNKLLVFGVILRFIIPTIFPDIPDSLDSLVELSTPINSFGSLKESFFYLSNGINPYNGGINHHSPLLVSFFYNFQQLLGNNMFTIFTNFLYALVDALISLRLVKINNWYHKYNSERRGEKLYKISDDLIVSFYLFNPLMILSTLSHSTLIFSLFFTIESVYQIINGNLPRSMISLSISSYLSLTPIYLIFPILAFAHRLIKVDQLSQIYFHGSAVFITSIGLLLFFSLILTSSAEFIDQCYGTVIRFDKLQPNIGLWWYFFTEMFDFFTPFYLGVFNLFHFIFILPITIRLFEYKSHKTVGDGFLAIFLCYVWLSFTKPYPTIGDLGFSISLMPIFSGTIIPYCKLIHITGIVWLIGLLLSPILYYCWIVLGNGNANFFYSMNLLFGAVHILILIDFLWGKLVSDYCDIHKVPAKDRHTIRLTQY